VTKEKNEAVVTILKYYQRIFLEELNKTTVTVSKYGRLLG